MNHADIDVVREVFDLTGARWTAPVLRALREGRLRFGEISRDVAGVARKQLTATLRQLEQDGFVLRTAFATIPPRVEYELTTLGKEFVADLERLGIFAIKNRDRIASARRDFELRNRAVATVSPAR